MRFYRDSDADTEVVWYKVPNDRPFIPFPNVFSSGEWENDNHPFQRQAGEYGLGEQLDADRKRPGRPLPRRVRFLGSFCGTAREWAEGAGLPVIGPPLLPDGFPPCCGSLACPVPNIFLCRTLYLFALALRAQYQGRATVQNFVTSQLMNTPDFPYSQDNTSSLTPGITVAVCDGWSLVLISGTSNFGQWLRHAMGSVAPSNYTTEIGVAYGTAPMYQEAAAFVVRLIVANNLPRDRPVILAGHSYGGAVANIAALLLTMSARPYQVQVVTFGAPKAMRLDGQQALARVDIPVINVANDGDPVPRLPPWLTVSRITGFLTALAALWDMWGDNRNRVGLRVNGSIYGSPTSYAQWAIIARLLQGLSANTDIAPWQPHEIDEYVRRLALQNCNGQVIADVFIWLMPETLRVDTVLPGYIPPGAGSVGIWLDAGKYGHLPVWNSTFLTSSARPVGLVGPRGYEGLTLTVQVLNPLNELWGLSPIFVGWDDGPDSTGEWPYPFPAETISATWLFALHLRHDFPGVVGTGSATGAGPFTMRMGLASMTFDDGIDAYTLDFPSEVSAETERVYWFTYRGGSVSLGVETAAGKAERTFDTLSGPSPFVFLYGSVGAFVDEGVTSPTQFPLDFALLYEVLIFTEALTDANLAIVRDRLADKYLFGPGGLLLGGSSAMDYFSPPVLASGGGLALAGSSVMLSPPLLSSGGGLYLAGSSGMSSGTTPVLVSGGGLYLAGSSVMSSGTAPVLSSGGGLYLAGSSGMVRGGSMDSGGGLYLAGSSAMM